MKSQKDLRRTNKQVNYWFSHTYIRDQMYQIFQELVEMLQKKRANVAIRWRKLWRKSKLLICTSIIHIWTCVPNITYATQMLKSYWHKCGNVGKKNKYGCQMKNTFKCEEYIYVNHCSSYAQYIVAFVDKIWSFWQKISGASDINVAKRKQASLPNEYLWYCLNH